MEKKFLKPQIELVSLNDVVTLATSTYGPIIGDPDDRWYEEELLDD